MRNKLFTISIILFIFAFPLKGQNPLQDSIIEPSYCDPIQTIPYLMTFDSVDIGTIPICFQTRYSELSC